MSGSAAANQVTAVDLNACAREPIHIPGAIQPHGVLLFVSGTDHTVQQLSDNSAVHLGVSPDDLLGAQLRDALTIFDLAPLEHALAQADPAAESPVRVVSQRDGSRASFDVLIHRVAADTPGLLLEFEPVPEQDVMEAARFLRGVQTAIAEVQATRTEDELFAVCAKVIARLSGFERVMVYRFDDAWNGKVVGEELTADVDSYFGLHFPASDIPAQARALYARTPLRLIPMRATSRRGYDPN
jgi:light-regulated signal transduction histidine kinase (bacteriophytochrome)